MDTNMNLNWLRSFEAVARLNGFTAASRELGLTQTAVSQHIKALEVKLGHDLFLRRAKSVELTEIGKAYLPSVRNALETLSLSTNGLFGPNLKNTIVVRASMAMILWLAPRLKTFQQSEPGISIKFVTAIWVDARDMQSIDVDIVLAPDRNVQQSLEKLCDEVIVPICGLETAVSIGSVADLRKISPIHIQGFDDHWARYLSAFDLEHDNTSNRLIVDTSVAATELAASNLGCAMLIERFASNAVERLQPVKIVGDAVALGQAHYLADRPVAREKQFAADAFKYWLRAQIW